jgi:menaquinone-dependent protoporphyrinogen oxidase
MPAVQAARTVMKPARQRRFTMRLLVAYATRNGSTRDVAEHIAAMLRHEGYDVDCLTAATAGDLANVEAVVLGAPLYAGRWHRDACRFVERHRDLISQRAFAVFALGPRTLDVKDVMSSRGQLEHALHKLDAPTPETVAVFGGVLDPKKLRFPFNRMAASDARDWDDIDTWAARLPAELGCGKAAAEAVDRRSELQQTPR